MSRAAPVGFDLLRSTVHYYMRHRRWRALVRALWRTAVLRDGGELCQACGRPYLRWAAPAPLWTELVGGEGGLLCPRCFDRLAQRADLRILWTPMVTSRAGVATTNHWCDPTRDRLLMGEPDPGYADGGVRDPQGPWGVVADALGWDRFSYYPPKSRTLAVRSDPDIAGSP